MAAKKSKKKAKGLSAAKILLWTVIGICVLFAILYIAVEIFGKKYGTMRYGICKVFLQQYVPFPKTLHITEVRETPKFARIHYTHTDAFGQYRLSRIQCNYNRDQDAANRQWLIKILSESDITVDQVAASGGISDKLLMSYIRGDRAKLPDATVIPRIAASIDQQRPGPIFVLETVTIDNRPVSEEKVKIFRESIPTILKNPPDLLYPLPAPQRIEDYKR